MYSNEEVLVIMKRIGLSGLKYQKIALEKKLKEEKVIAKTSKLDSIFKKINFLNKKIRLYVTTDTVTDK